MSSPLRQKAAGWLACHLQLLAPWFWDWLLVLWGARARISDAVVIEREVQPGVFLVKRIIKIEDGKYWVEGDNKVHSNDSRKWGSINGKEILARVIFRIRKGASE